MGFMDSLKKMLSGNKDKADEVIDKAGDMVDEKTGGKHEEHVDRGQEMAKDFVEDLDDE
jgi:ribosomal protein S7